MAQGFDDSHMEESASLNIAGLVDKFMLSDTDLFQFVMKYKFPEKVGELSWRNEFHCTSGFRSTMTRSCLISPKIVKMDYVNERKQKLKLGYAIIKPNRKAIHE